MQGLPHGFSPPDSEPPTWNRPAPQGNGPTPGAAAQVLLIGIGLIIMGVFWMTVAGGSGAPPGIGLVFIALGIVSLFAFPFFKARDEEKEQERESLEEVEEERFKDEVAQAVKERMQGTIKVRCRYCGSLNDEVANKCESCGAAL